MDLDIDGYLLSTEFIGQIATFVATFFTLMFQMLFGRFFGVS